MDGLWGSGDPNTYLASTTNIAYDDHNYVKYSGVAQSQAAYLAHSCTDDRSGNSPVFVGEWSLSVDSAIEHTADWDPNTHVNWYKKWWAAQVMQYEKSANGWVCTYPNPKQSKSAGDAVLTTR
jgi:glucan endo-1,6-beta-glucosidase